jgi:SAM-dependent methyltransferase
MFSKTAQHYDKIYAAKDYQAEVQQLLPVIEQHLGSRGRRLLDVACGTGHHLAYLQEDFEVEGLDLSAELLEMARQRLPGVALHLGDMTAFDLGKRFDVVTCLFSSIGYVKTVENLHRAVACMAAHLEPGGIVVLEPWFTPEAWKPNTVHALFIDEPELKIARVNTSYAEGRLSYFDLHHLIGTPQGTDYVVERHELGLFTVEEMEAALEEAGLAVSYDADGLTGRGLYVGKQATERG